MTALSARMNRKHLLVALTAVFIVGNLMSAAAQDVQLLIATRLVTAVAHAVIASVGAALAISWSTNPSRLAPSPPSSAA